MIGLCIPAAERIGPGDKYLAAELASVGKTPVVAIVTKTDEATREQVARQLAEVSELGDWADIVPVSAVSGFQLDVLADVLVSHLPPGRPLYPDGDLTDEPEQQLVAELIREAILEGVRDELPHSIAVHGRGDGPARGPAGPDRRARDHVRRAAQPEGDRHRLRRAPGSRRSARRPASRSRPCWAPRSTWTCASRSPRTGSATPSSCAAWASTTDATGCARQAGCAAASRASRGRAIAGRVSSQL